MAFQGAILDYLDGICNRPDVANPMINSRVLVALLSVLQSSEAHTVRYLIHRLIRVLLFA